MREYGCERVVKSTAECLAIEPALAGARMPIVGGTYTAEDESGDAHTFTSALATQCEARGVTFRYDAAITGIDLAGGRFQSIRLAGGESLVADACVIALGSYSPLLLQPLGLRIPVYPAKGYSVTIPLPDASTGPTVSLTDDGAKLVYSRLGNRLRVAGTAEFAGHDLNINPARLAPLLRRVREIFPALEVRAEAIEPWTGLRPATPSNVPLIGATSHTGLYLNTGHGTLGWTMAAGSGRLIADMISGRGTAIDSSPYRIQ
jgi:D-amino-acid dehydrogenase